MKAIGKLFFVVVGVVALAGPSMVTAQPVGGTVTQIHLVGANTDKEHSVALVAGREVVVIVIGDGDTDLDLYVYDRLGVEIVRDTGLTDNCVVKFTPRFNETYTIKVKNLGRISNRYALIVK